jgi:hypothetical protein
MIDRLEVAEALVKACRKELERLEAQLADLKRRVPEDYSRNWRDYSFKYADEDFR